MSVRLIKCQLLSVSSLLQYFDHGEGEVPAHFTLNEYKKN
jgi:hypothetical protein